MRNKIVNDIKYQYHHQINDAQQVFAEIAQPTQTNGVPVGLLEVSSPWFAEQCVWWWLDSG